MTDNRRVVPSPISEELTEQAWILHQAVREAVRTSPDSFLKTLADLEAKGLDYWIDEIQSSTWVLAEQHGRSLASRPASSQSRARTKSHLETRVILNRCGSILISGSGSWENG